MVASLAQLAAPVISADADVDAANLALLLPGRDGEINEFFGSEVAEVDPERCTGCGECVKVCRFDSIVLDGDLALIDALACEGCRVCTLVCPVDAIEMREQIAGHWLVRETAWGPLIHAELGIGRDNSGKLVSEVRKEVRRLAEERRIEIAFIDGPPGIGCPVHAALTGVNLALLITEPSPSGEHDLDRALETCRHFKTPAAVVINKEDLAPGFDKRIERLATRHSAPVIGRLPFDKQVPLALVKGKTLLSLPAFKGLLEAILRRLMELIG